MACRRFASDDIIARMETGLVELVGSIHVHTIKSDGTGDLARVARAARGAGLDFVVVTDHDTKGYGLERDAYYVEGVLFLFGAEVTLPEGHFVVLGFTGELPVLDGMESYVRWAKEVGALGIVAHPHGGGSAAVRVPGKPWKAPRFADVGGIEVWSYMFDWLDAVGPLSLLRYLLRPDEALSGPQRKTLEWWDEFAARRPFPGVGALDVHGLKRFPARLFGFLSYERLLPRLCTHLWTRPLSGEPRVDSALVLEALRAGRGFLALDSLARSNGFLLQAGGALPGEAVRLSEGLTMALESPVGATWQLVREGRVVALAEGRTARFEASGPGVYRVEGYLGGRPWLFTNHVRVVADA